MTRILIISKAVNKLLIMILILLGLTLKNFILFVNPFVGEKT
jgi:hypothetical protein